MTTRPDKTARIGARGSGMLRMQWVMRVAGLGEDDGLGYSLSGGKMELLPLSPDSRGPKG